MKRSRFSYWSHNRKLRRLLGMRPLPLALSMQGWKDFEAKEKADTPIRYWFMETFVSNLQDVVMFPMDVVHSTRMYIINGWKDKLHTLSSDVLEKGKYYELDTRLLFCCFETLEKFVERGMCYKDTTPEQHLQWAMSALDEDGNPSQQAVAAKEVHELYHWWKERKVKGVYPNFSEEAESVLAPDELVVYKAKEVVESWNSEDKEWKGLWRRVYIEEDRLEELQHTVDTGMLIRLMNIRRSLWS